MATDNDDLLGDIRAAQTELEGGGADAARDPAATDTGAPPPEGAGDREEAPARARDESGRFAKGADKGTDKPRETLTLKEPTVETPPAEAPKPETAPATPKSKVEGVDIPPVHWKGSSKLQWGRMPAEVRSEIVEQSNRLAAMETEMAPLKELFDVNREFLVNQAGSVPAAMAQLMQFARMSIDNPVALAEHVLRARGLDPRAAFGGQPQQAPAVGQQQDVQTHIAQLVQQQLQPIHGWFEQQSLNQEIQRIQAFRADPAHPYFNDVAPRIEGLLKAGAAKDLKEAYDQAVWADPVIRQQLLSQQAEEAKRTQTAEAERAQKARAASLRGSPLPGAPAGGASQSGSVHDDIRAAMAELSGA